ncbi:MAG: hypothetical protein H6672_06860 [Anaerolineaceae bacterium]|nr:hypothetical protein [Anaerolineaceae bacterium]
MSQIRVIQYGVGAMGSNMVQLLQQKPQAKMVGAIDIDPAKIDRDLGDVSGLGKSLGIKVGYPPDVVLAGGAADVVLHATTAFADEAVPLILGILKHKINVITIAQELFFPLGKNREKAAQLDKAAKEAGVSVTACGINPGFIMDIIPIVGSLPCWEVERVTAQRIVDFSPYGPDEMSHIGAGLTEAQFRAGVARGEIGHIGLLETTAMVAYCLGLDIDELRQTKEPIIARTRRMTDFTQVEPGRVCGFRQNVFGLTGGEMRLEFSMIGLLAPNPDEDGVQLGDYTRIEGKPNVDIRIKEEIAQRGGLGTAAVAVNTIPRVMAAPPGFHRLDQVGLPHYWTGKAAPQPVEHISYS